MSAALAGILGAHSIRLVGADRSAEAVSGFDEALVADVSAPSAALVEAARAADLIVLALPLEPAEAALRWIGETARPGALVVETFSVKAPAAPLAALLPETIEFLGINPLFAPSLDWTGRPVLAVPYRGGEAAERFLGWIRGAGSSVATLSADAHDRMLARRQGAAHAALLAFGAALAADEGEVPLSFGPPPYQTLLMALSRIVFGDAHVYAEIQALNPDAAAVRADLVAALEAMNGDLDMVRRQVEALHALRPGLEEAKTACARLFEKPILPSGDES